MTKPAATHQETIARVRAEILTVLGQVVTWFSKPEDLQNYRPASGGWTVAEVLEHITLTTHYLLLVARKSCETALKREARGEAVLNEDESDLERLFAVGEWGSFPWLRPAHMEPTGTVRASEVLQTMIA